PVPFAGRHGGRQAAAVLEADVFCHGCRFVGGHELEGAPEESDEEVVTPRRELETHLFGGDPVALRRATYAGSLLALDVHVEIAAGGELVEVVTGDVRVQFEVLGHLG